ncbi:CBO0543 family protein [Alteribacillus sp. JSM 102045]|uniref:CBO0543 family protein n=1 Tax=Alteribacillus sp. JSM 102045 TaxID=1562101 RepID=UPI0035C1D113
MDGNLQQQIKQAYDLVVRANNQMFYIWKENVIYTWQWWLGVGLTISPWIFWIIFRKKDSTIRLLSTGVFVILIISWLDFIGISLGLWYYTYEVLPFIPNYLPWDFSLLPLFILSLIQIKPNVSPLIKAVFFSVVSAFVAEPFFKSIGLYQPIYWKHVYSFSVYIVIYLIADYISKRNTWAKV